MDSNYKEIGVYSIMRLDKYLTELQIGTRSQVKQIIRKGSVFVNGEPVKKPEYSVDEANDTIIYNGKEIGRAHV